MQQLVEIDRLAAADAFDQTKIRARQQPNVVRVLPVDALEALGDDHARAALAVALAGDDDRDACVAQRIAPDRQLVAGLEAGVRIAAQRGVEMHHHRQRRDLVGGDVVAQRARGVERHRTALELRSNERRVGAQEKTTRFEPHRVHCNSMPAFFTSLAYFSFSLLK
jgi:hypothetical protein